MDMDAVCGRSERIASSYVEKMLACSGAEWEKRVEGRQRRPHRSNSMRNPRAVLIVPITLCSGDNNSSSSAANTLGDTDDESSSSVVSRSAGSADSLKQQQSKSCTEINLSQMDTDHEKKPLMKKCEKDNV